jgi:hypothetical protein
MDNERETLLAEKARIDALASTLAAALRAIAATEQ